jgi:predicted nuclease of predicted toxin-antitoxin system
LARLYTNENFPAPAVEALRNLGHDVLTSHDAGRSNLRIPDDEVLEYAVSQERVLVTLNRKHFVKLHQNRPTHSGVIVCGVDLDFHALAERIHTAILKAGSLSGPLIRVNRI